VSPVVLTEGRGGRGWGRRQIKRRRENLVLYKSFNTLRDGESKTSPCSVFTAVFLKNLYFPKLPNLFFTVFSVAGVLKKLSLAGLAKLT
jgi:hypothetical protein